MDIRLDLSKHCIETEIKRIYNRVLSRYFKPGADKHTLEQTLEVTRHALEIFDFPSLRSLYPELTGKVAAEVVLSLVENDRLTITINNKTVTPILRTSKKQRSNPR